MANPQKENGYTSVANELLDILIKTPLPSREKDMILFVMRKTYGYQKKADIISLSQFQEALKTSRPTVVKCLKNLLARGILVKTPLPGVVKTPLLAISLQKDYEKWVVNTPLLVKNLNKLVKTPLPKSVNTPLPTKEKRKYTKEIKTSRPTADDEINQVLNVFYDTINPSVNYGNRANRDAAGWLIAKYGLPKILNAARYASSIQVDRYAPTITNPYQLKEKLSALIKYQVTRTQKADEARKEIGL